MSQDRPRDAATVLFNLPGYRVLDAVDDPGGGRRVLVEPVDPVGHCPDCGFDSTRVHSRPVSRVADVPTADHPDALAAAVSRDGPLVDGKPHPAIVECRQQRLTLARLLASLRVPEDPQGGRVVG